MIERGAATRAERYRQMLAMSLAATNRWDSALAAEPVPLQARRLELLAAALGDRPRGASRPRPSSGAEWTFLDGVGAAIAGQTKDVTLARGRLRESSEPGSSAAADALDAHLIALSGDTAAAGNAMAALEWRRANLPFETAAAEFPSVTPLDRIFGARWLAAAGNTAEAERLLRFVDAPFTLVPSIAVSVFMREDIRQLGRELGATR
jgi:hypothetical protein